MSKIKDKSIKECLKARKQAVARKTYVGAALYTNKKIIIGFNIENRCCKGLHAEEVAIINARLKDINPKDIQGIIISFDYYFPACGYCRQALWEYTFNPNLLITVVDFEGKILGEDKLENLYPNPYPLESFQVLKFDEAVYK